MKSNFVDVVAFDSDDDRVLIVSEEESLSRQLQQALLTLLPYSVAIDDVKSGVGVVDRIHRAIIQGKSYKAVFVMENKRVDDCFSSMSEIRATGYGGALIFIPVFINEDSKTSSFTAVTTAGIDAVLTWPLQGNQLHMQLVLAGKFVCFSEQCFPPLRKRGYWIFQCPQKDM